MFIMSLPLTVHLSPFILAQFRLLKALRDRKLLGSHAPFPTWRLLANKVPIQFPFSISTRYAVSGANLACGTTRISVALFMCSAMCSKVPADPRLGQLSADLEGWLAQNGAILDGVRSGESQIGTEVGMALIATRYPPTRTLHKA